MKLNPESLELKKLDPILSTIINENLEPLVSRGGVYESLLSSIISQQISTSAAASVRAKFLKLFKNKFPSAKILIKTSGEKLKSVGLSRQKISYMKNVAEHFLIEKLNEDKFYKMTDQEIIDDLVKIKGVGEWTAEMILIFSLNRKDVFSYKDLALVAPVLKLYKINKNRYSPKALKIKVLKITSKWSPYRTLASRHLWKYYGELKKKK